MTNQLQNFIAKSAIKANDLEHRRKINFNNHNLHPIFTFSLN